VSSPLPGLIVFIQCKFVLTPDRNREAIFTILFSKILTLFRKAGANIHTFFKTKNRLEKISVEILSQK